MQKSKFKQIIVAIYLFFHNAGIDFIKTFKFIKGIPFYVKDYVKLKKQKGNNKEFKFGTPYVIVDDKFSEAGSMSGHYYHQDLLIARRIYENNPKKHVDIGSRIDGFVAHVATFREIEIFDIRKLQSKDEKIKFKLADLMKLPKNKINYCDSISSLHVIEHFGLGRYGDPIDYKGHIKAINNIHKILKKGGKFYFSVPIGPQRIEFNAHRVFDVSYLIDLFKDKFIIDSFSYVDDKGDLHKNVNLIEKDINRNFDCWYGCGIFEMTKK